MDALEGLAPSGVTYAHLGVAQAFDWSGVSEALGPGEWYLVAFRSIRKPEADEARLTAYDDLAHAEAAASRGFVHYQKGPCSTDGSCLSFCLWTDRTAARAAAGQRHHAEAAQLVHEMYASYTLEFLRVRSYADGRPLEFEPYDPLPISA
jgi:hypothetical protein